MRWKWVDYLNIELYEHNLDQAKAPEAPIYYDSDEESFFDRQNHNNLMRFWEEIEIIRYEMARQRRLMQQQYHTIFTVRSLPPAYPAPDNDSLVPRRPRRGRRRGKTL